MNPFRYCHYLPTAWLRYKVLRLCEPLIKDQILCTPDGFRWHVAPTESRWDRRLSLHIAAGTYEPETLGVLRSLIHQGDTIVDVGAHAGAFTLAFAHWVGRNGRVIAVEPHPDNVARLEEHRALNGLNQITILHTAASDHAGTAMFYGSEAWGSLIPCADAVTHAVPTARLDDLLRDVRRIAGLKLDVEGYEYEALQGAESILRRDRQVICFEIAKTHLTHRGLPQTQVTDFVQAIGYRLHLIRNGKLVVFDPAHMTRVENIVALPQ